MYIHVNFSSYDSSRVCDYFNRHKPEHTMSLHPLDRAEGGFMIALSDSPENKHLDENRRIKQARWQNKNLFTPVGYYTFTPEEWTLLHQAIETCCTEEDRPENRVELVDKLRPIIR